MNNIIKGLPAALLVVACGMMIALAIIGLGLAIAKYPFIVVPMVLLIGFICLAYSIGSES